MPNIENIKKYKNIHMIGIGGISMSGIAAILKNWGFNVTGSDASDSEAVQLLRSKGIKVVIGHSLEDVAKADVVVYSAAIKQTDPEIVEAHRLKIPTIERADFLGEITRCYNDTICISGTHGKTTTTSMVSLCFLDALTDPSIQVGAMLKPLNGNYRVGNSEHFIIEACEYVESFLKFSPKAEIILDIDNDHLDYFKTFDNIKNAFIKYVKLLPDNGLLIVNGDDKNCLDLCQYTNAKKVTYGIDNTKANFVAKNIVFDNDGFPEFDVYYNDEFFMNLKLSVPGILNVLNALACTAISTEYGISKKDIQDALIKFTGAHRRFEFKGKINNNVSVYDDYAHHPDEITATLKTAEHYPHKKLWVVFQPHTYTRTKALLPEFAKALSEADAVVLADIYAAREKNTLGISSKNLADEIEKLGTEVHYFPTFDEIENFLLENCNDNDLLITMGAGDVYKIGEKLLGK